ncbi:MAG: M48 family metallopeptidase [Nitrospirota bacterium]
MDTGVTTVEAPVTGRGLCFGEGLAPQGERVGFALEAERVVLWPGTEREHPVSYQSIRVEPGGFERRQFKLTWAERDAPWALVLDDDALAGRVRANPPPGLHAEFQRLGLLLRRGRLLSGFGWTVITAIALGPILVLSLLWWQADRIVGAAADRVPVSWEQELGESAYAQLTLGATVLTEGPSVEAVRAIGERLTAQIQSPYTFRWHVIDDRQVNAFAVPGGHVVVFTGLLREAGSPEELAGVLAHEVQHVVLRHSVHGLIRSLGWSATLQILFGGAGPLSGIGEAASRLGSLKFGRDQETASDVEGLKLLRRAKIDPKGMVSFFEHLASKENGIALLSTHPMSADRADRLRTEIEAAGAWPTEPLPVAWADVKASLARGGES